MRSEGAVSTTVCIPDEEIVKDQPTSTSLEVPELVIHTDHAYQNVPVDVKISEPACPNHEILKHGQLFRDVYEFSELNSRLDQVRCPGFWLLSFFRFKLCLLSWWRALLWPQTLFNQQVIIYQQKASVFEWRKSNAWLSIQSWTTTLYWKISEASRVCQKRSSCCDSSIWNTE